MRGVCRCHFWLGPDSLTVVLGLVSVHRKEQCEGGLQCALSTRVATAVWCSEPRSARLPRQRSGASATGAEEAARHWTSRVRAPLRPLPDPAVCLTASGRCCTTAG